MMKTRTEIILIVLKYLALLGGIGFSIECGAELLSLIASFVSPGWAEKVYKVDPGWFLIREKNAWFSIFGICILIFTSALKATVWYPIYYLLEKLQLQSPFSMKVTKKLEDIAILLASVWIIMGIIGKTYAYYLHHATDLQLPGLESGGEYFFIAGIVYIVSQIFKRGIEMQEENQLTV
jgi:hypothetical protein